MSSLIGAWEAQGEYKGVIIFTRRTYCALRVSDKTPEHHAEQKTADSTKVQAFDSIRAGAGAYESAKGKLKLSEQYGRLREQPPLDLTYEISSDELVLTNPVTGQVSHYKRLNE